MDLAERRIETEERIRSADCEEKRTERDKELKSRDGEREARNRVELEMFVLHLRCFGTCKGGTLWCSNCLWSKYAINGCDKHQKYFDTGFGEKQLRVICRNIVERYCMTSTVLCILNFFEDHRVPVKFSLRT